VISCGTLRSVIEYGLPFLKYTQTATCCTKLQQQHPFNGPLSRTPRVSQYQERKTNLDLPKQETVSGSGISWAVCKSAPRSRQINMPAPHHSVFYRGCPFCRPTNSVKAPKAVQNYSPRNRPNSSQLCHVTLCHQSIHVCKACILSHFGNYILNR